MKRNKLRSESKKNDDAALFCEIWESQQELNCFSRPARGHVEFLDALEAHDKLKKKIEKYDNNRSIKGRKH